MKKPCLGFLVYPSTTMSSVLGVPKQKMRLVAPVRYRTTRIAVAALLAAGGVPRSNGATDRAFRVMTYDIESGRGALERTAETIRSLSPDLVALQEVDVHWADRSAFADQAAVLGADLHMSVRFARIYRIPNPDPAQPPREFGVALLSRFPIDAWQNDTITRLSTRVEDPGRFADENRV